MPLSPPHRLAHSPSSYKWPERINFTTLTSPRQVTELLPLIATAGMGVAAYMAANAKIEAEQAKIAELEAKFQKYWPRKVGGQNCLGPGPRLRWFNPTSPFQPPPPPPPTPHQRLSKP